MSLQEMTGLGAEEASACLAARHGICTHMDGLSGAMVKKVKCGRSLRRYD